MGVSYEQLHTLYLKKLFHFKVKTTKIALAIDRSLQTKFFPHIVYFPSNLASFSPQRNKTCSGVNFGPKSSTLDTNISNGCNLITQTYQQFGAKLTLLLQTRT